MAQHNLLSGRIVVVYEGTTTGQSNVGVRAGFRDYDTWGQGLAFAIDSPTIDAPEYLASGSLRGGHTGRQFVTMGPMVTFARGSCSR